MAVPRAATAEPASRRVVVRAKNFIFVQIENKLARGAEETTNTALESNYLLNYIETDQ